MSIGSECRVKVHEISFQKPTGPAVWCELILGRRRRCWRRGRAGVRSRGSPGHLGRADDAAPRPSPTGLQGGLATVAKEMLLDFGRFLVPNSGDGTPEISGILAECSGSPAKLGAAGFVLPELAQGCEISESPVALAEYLAFEGDSTCVSRK